MAKKVGNIQVKSKRRDVVVQSGRAPRRVGDGYLYSTYRFSTSASPPAAVAIAANAEGLKFFSTQIGATGQGFGTAQLNYLQTNIQQAGTIPGEQAYRLDSIGFGGVGTLDVRLTKQVEALGYLKFNTPAFDWYMGPAELWPLGLNPGGFGGGGGGTPQEAGPGPAQAMRKLSVPIILPPNATFSVSYVVPLAYSIPASVQQAAQDIDFRIAMFGRWVTET